MWSQYHKVTDRRTDLPWQYRAVKTVRTLTVCRFEASFVFISSPLSDKSRFNSWPECRTCVPRPSQTRKPHMVILASGGRAAERMYSFTTSVARLTAWKAAPYHPARLWSDNPSCTVDQRTSPTDGCSRRGSLHCSTLAQKFNHHHCTAFVWLKAANGATATDIAPSLSSFTATGD